MGHHSSVNYVEPNLTAVSNTNNPNGGIVSWKVDDDYERTPRLEDYCITLNLEVEVCSRENISVDEKITSQVLILSYKTSQNGSDDTVNFMGGTKVKCGNEENTQIPYFTTNYADMYVGDLVDYGTTELIGIKSVDIEYKKSCVPIISIKFTDVRGLSLFQPTELSRTNSYQGIGGINADNVAQSFFQCFFRVPMPKFTITIKGFYGKAVTYEMLCDKFDTNFDSQNGNFEVNTRFIGYGYSFLTDVSMDALLAAPYSDYGGLSGAFNNHWAKGIESGRFTIPNKDGTSREPMPTLYQIYENIQLLSKKTISSSTYLDEEEVNHENEIRELSEIKNMCEDWYRSLFNLCVERYGKEYCFLFERQAVNNEVEYSRIIVLTKEDSPTSLAKEYEQYPDAFKEMNALLHSTIDEFNAKDSSFKKLPNVSDDFSDYQLNCLFNRMFVNMKGEIVFNGFDKRNKLPETETVNNVFKKVSYSGATDDDIIAHKRHVLGTIYNDGTTQYVKCYRIELDYSSITTRIRALVADSNRNIKDKLKEKRLKHINNELFKEMNWYPSVENFTRIMMAHLETMMRLMFDVIKNSDGRTAEQLGVTTGPDGTCSDVNVRDNVIPPFPRVTKNVTGDDEITKVEDTWVGEFKSGTKPFTEIDFIDGFFNGIEKIRALRKDLETSMNEQSRYEEMANKEESLVSYPLTPSDLFTKLPIYGSPNEISNEAEKGYHFSGKVALRMFNILSTSSFSKHYNIDIGKIARVEADNFYDSCPITNKNFLEMIRNKTFTSENILTHVTSNNNDGKCPWGSTPLFLNNGNKLSPNRYVVNSSVLFKNTIYPIQDMSFKSLNATHAFFEQGKISSRGDTVAVESIPSGAKSARNLKNDNNSGFGNVVISDDVDFLKNVLGDKNNEVSEDYRDFYKTICEASEFKSSNIANFFNTKGTSLLGVNDDEKVDFSTLSYEIDNGDISSHYLGKFYGVNSNGDLVENTSPAMLGVRRYWEKDKTAPVCCDLRIDYLQRQKASMLFCTKINESAYKTSFIQDSPFGYIPKLCALRLGAICFADACGSVGSADDIFTRVTKLYKVKPTQIEVGIVKEMSSAVEYEFAKYFYNNVISRDSKLFTLFEHLNPKDGKEGMYDEKKYLLKKSAQYVRDLTNEMLKPVLVVKLTSFAVGSRNANLDVGSAKTYLKSFMSRLEERYEINYTKDDNGNLIKTTDEPKKTNDDMKSELYRYMKQMYDKWVPMSSFKDWEVDSFFPNDNGEEVGHTFYFIDSYYNYIGDKLLVNPLNLANTVIALMDNGDVNATLLGFLADVFGQNRCMMYTLQNFSDLNKENSMNELFTPMSFNSIEWDKVNKYPSFVVVYPYEPSKNLSVMNNEYNDDGFMLNDEFDTPKAIRSKNVDNNTRHYRIPAFGVSYGKQYQSYFKSVNVNMQNPVATQQAIKAKHNILQQTQHPKERGVVGQDLYDIYATQSYTCNVEMMGCAWIQPLMYFVLLNIPMFRGSYLIMNVKHSIRPGDMTTTFTGCRMANVSNKIIEDIFTDEDNLVNGMLDDSFETDKQLKADIDNDCPYKIYPLWGSDDVELSGDVIKDAANLMTALMDSSNGFTKEAAAGIVGNMYVETLPKFDHTSASIDSDKFVAGGLCGWNDRYFNLTNLLKKNTDGYGQKENKSPSMTVNQAKSGLSKVSPIEQITFLRDTIGLVTYAKSSKKYGISEINKCKTPKEAALSFAKNYEKCDTASYDERAKMAQKFYDSYSSSSFSTTNTSKPKEDTNTDVQQALFDAVNKSSQFTPSIGKSLKLIKPLGVNDYYEIVQEDGKNDKLHKVFDMMLNSEYFSYVQELVWVGNTNTLQSEIPPISIYYKASESVKSESVYVSVIEVGNKVSEYRKKYDITDGNTYLLKSLAKKASTMNEDSFKKMVEQVKDTTLLEKYKPQECETLFVTKGSLSTNSILVDNVECSLKNGKIGDWDVQASVNFLMEHARDSFSQNVCKPNNILRNPPLAGCVGKCWGFVKRALHAGGFKLANSVSAYQATDFLQQNGFRCIHKGTVVGHKGSDYQNKCEGDITVFDKTKEHPHGHINMWCNGQWISDFKQSGNWVNGSHTLPFTVWRYTGSGKR